MTMTESELAKLLGPENYEEYKRWATDTNRQWGDHLPSDVLRGMFISQLGPRLELLELKARVTELEDRVARLESGNL